MGRGSTLFLRIVIFLIGAPVLVLCIYELYFAINNRDYIIYPILIGMYVSLIPFYAALYQTYQLLNYIEKNEAFSELSVKALKKIKFCALIFSGIYVFILPFVPSIAMQEEAPGLIIIGMVPIFLSLVIAVFAAVLQRLLQEAIDMKSENELTV